MKDKLKLIQEKALAAFQEAKEIKDIDELKVKFLGKKGELTAILKEMGKLSAEERPVIGQMANEVRAEIEKMLDESKKRLEAAEMEARLANEKIDVTMPGKERPEGHKHPMSIVIDEINNIFMGMGYEVVDGPEIEKEETGCVIVTSLKEAAEKTTDIYQEDRNLLWTVYKRLCDGSMKLPLEENYVVRELVDVSFKKTDCVEKGHGHKQWLAEDNTQLEIVFDLGLKAGAELKVLAYINEEWTPVEAVVNADGTVTCIFEDFCPVAFCVPEVKEIPPTGDAMGAAMTKWIVLMAVSVVALVLLVVFRRKIFR